MGAAVARTGLDRRTPLATATLVIAASAPDVDVLSYAWGSYFALAFRRGITHGIPAQAAIPFAVAGAMLAWDRWVRRRRDPGAEPARPGQILLLSFLGLLTHPVLDWLNIYGMRWGLPFVESWSYGDTLFIIDPWLWLVLGGAVFLAGARAGWLWLVLGVLTTLIMAVAPVPALAKGIWLAGILSLPVLRRAGWPRGEAGRRALARGTLAAVLAYILAMSGANALGSRQVLAAAEARGLAPLEVMLSPTPANPFVWDVELVTPAGYVPGRHAWLSTSRITLHPERVAPLLRTPAGTDAATVERVLASARQEPDVRHYLVWSRYPYAEVRREEGGWWVRYSDARYDDREDAGGLGGVTVRVPDGD